MDMYNFSTQFFSQVWLLPLADDEVDEFGFTGIVGEETSPLQNLVTRNNIGKAYAIF